MAILDRPQISWRSAALDEQIMVLDLGALYSDPLIALYYSNLDHVLIEANDTNAWGSSIFPSTQADFDYDPDLCVYLSSLQIIGDVRYVRITVPVQSTVDGADWYEIGIVAFPTDIQEFNLSKEQFEWPVGITKTIYENEVELIGTTDKQLLSSLPTLTFQLSGTMSQDRTSRAKFNSVFANPSKPLIFVDFEKTDWSYYLGKRSYQIDMPRQNAALMKITIGFKTIA